MPKKIVEVTNQGFQMVKSHNKGKKQYDRNIGFKPKNNLVYKPVLKRSGIRSSNQRGNEPIKINNSFATLSQDPSHNKSNDGYTIGIVKEGILKLHDESDSEDVEMSLMRLFSPKYI